MLVSTNFCTLCVDLDTNYEHFSSDCIAVDDCRTGLGCSLPECVMVCPSKLLKVHCVGLSWYLVSKAGQKLPFHDASGLAQLLQFPFVSSSLPQQLTKQELWQMVKQHYGNDLGLSHEEMESLQMTPDSISYTQTR